MTDPVLGSRLSTDGETRDVSRAGDGQPVYGLWLMPGDDIADGHPVSNRKLR